ncbi:hypothetical protein DPEC_G00266880 [Dallia pectoralis]|uniref:Uncharacterized protein n=1 Tax=Dallia pectoralis TaxID=75939 RepID=A0ACC2FNG4_DALPE|nr:hypothetical protein DPEC_G00266880 [Dallia pectoralis]
MAEFMEGNADAKQSFHKEREKKQTAPSNLSKCPSVPVALCQSPIYTRQGPALNHPFISLRSPRPGRWQCNPCQRSVPTPAPSRNAKRVSWQLSLIVEQIEAVRGGEHGARLVRERQRTCRPAAKHSPPTSCCPRF